jgi:hypothetical protein
MIESNWKLKLHKIADNDNDIEADLASLYKLFPLH